MKRISIALLGSVSVLLVGLAMVAQPVLAHHGRGSTYEANREIAIKGVVSSVLWRNPHISIFLDVRDSSGKVTQWTVEHSPIHRLAREGYTRNTVTPGMEVTIYVNPGSEGKPIGLCRKVVLADGKEVFIRGGAPD